MYFLHVPKGSRIQKTVTIGDGERWEGSLVTKGEFTTVLSLPVKGIIKNHDISVRIS